MIEVKGQWSNEEKGWVSETLCIKGNCWLHIILPFRGIVVIKKSESLDGPWPKALVTDWDGEEYGIKIYGSTKNRYIRIYTTEIPKSINIAYI